MKVFHICQTPMAGAPGMLSKLLQKYSGWDSAIYAERTAVSAGDFAPDYDLVAKQDVPKYIEEADIIHFHNTQPDRWPVWSKELDRKPFIIQLHAGPDIMKSIVVKHPTDCYTIAQKHAVLYGTLPVVPNIIDIYDEAYKPLPSNPEIFTIVYAPSDKTALPTYQGTCRGKGYDETMKVLTKIQARFPNHVKLKILHQVPKAQVLEACRDADCRIDECVTGGYHLASLEGLSTGCVTVANIMPEVHKILEHLFNKKLKLPWLVSDIASLESKLSSMISMKFNNPEQFEEMKKYSRRWMEANWNPVKLVKRFSNIYSHRLRRIDDPWHGLGISSNAKMVRAAKEKSYKAYAAFQPEKELNVINARNMHQDRSALIVGLGPSLKTLDMDKIIKEFDPLVFTCNYYHQYFPTLRPDYYSCIDETCFREAIQQVPENVPVLTTPLNNVFAYEHKRFWLHKDKEAFRELFKYPYEYDRPCTIVIVMIMYALYFGCKEIYLAGIDLTEVKTANNYAYSEGHSEDRLNEKFRPFNNNIDHIKQEMKLLGLDADHLGIKIYNLNPDENNKLTMFQRKW